MSQITPAHAAAEPGQRRSTGEVSEAEKLRAEVDRLGGLIIEQAVELAVLRGRASWG